MEPRLAEVLTLWGQEKITKSAVPDLLRLGSIEPSVTLESLARAANLLRIFGESLKSLAAAHGYDFPGIMRKYRLQVDAAELQALVSSKGNIKT